MLGSIDKLGKSPYSYLDMALSQEEQSKYKALYLQTAKQYLKEIEENLSKLASGDDSSEVIEIIHRSAHSLKGQSEMMGYTSLTEVSKTIETIFQAKIEKNIILSDELKKKLHEIVKAMKQSLDSLDQTNHEMNLSQVGETLKSLVPHVD